MNESVLKISESTRMFTPAVKIRSAANDLKDLAESNVIRDTLETTDGDSGPPAQYPERSRDQESNAEVHSLGDVLDISG